MEEEKKDIETTEPKENGEHSEYKLEFASTKPKTSPTETEEITIDEKNLALAAHISGIAIAIIGPLIILLVKGKESKYVSHHALQALVFQAVMSFLVFFSFLFGVILFVALIGIPILLFGIFLLILYYICTISATIAGYKGKWYTYPLMSGLAERS
jgi:uncharacterized Tic20 family protein